MLVNERSHFSKRKPSNKRTRLNKPTTMSKRAPRRMLALLSRRSTCDKHTMLYKLKPRSNLSLHNKLMLHNRQNKGRILIQQQH